MRTYVRFYAGPLRFPELCGYVGSMDDKDGSKVDEFEADIEEAIDDKREGVLAADATGMVGNEQFTRLVELREGEVTPPV
jgi:hypothetical protein